ncbi:hypothetical protein [Lysinibacillus capsici]|uniref:hypothetical protein n=1 Tax=Lysinibacillus capsici TaxID=2115968 RepID=UPI000E20307E|nr:hypothetical protein [Lysinibacillus capsici]RDV33838.1 hypothetical protein C7B89_04530 [Lysinibacillus capsici]
MKKIVALVMLALMLVACGNEDEKKSDISEKQKNQEQEFLKFFQITGLSKDISEMSDKEYYDEVFDVAFRQAGSSMDYIKNTYWERSFLNNYDYNELNLNVSDAIEGLNNLKHNVELIPTYQFSNKNAKKAEKLKDAFIDNIDKRIKLYKKAKKEIKEDMVNLEVWKNLEGDLKEIDKHLKKSVKYYQDLSESINEK